MTREELIKEILKSTGLKESILHECNTEELEQIYADRVLAQGMI